MFVFPFWVHIERHMFVFNPLSSGKKTPCSQSSICQNAEVSQLICFCCARSRTTEESYVTLYTEVLSVELTRDEVCEKFRAWARSSVQGQCVELALSKRDKEASSSARMTYRMYCTSCNLCSAGSGW